jgi:uncharacterized protein YkwD
VNYSNYNSDSSNYTNNNPYYYDNYNNYTYTNNNTTTNTIPQQNTSGLTADENALVSLINQARQSAGLSALQVDPYLLQSARAKCNDMVTNDYFDHNSPIYGDPFSFIRRFTSSYSSLAENISKNTSVQGAHTGFMNSPQHRANILNSKYTSIGVGIVYDSNDGLLKITEQFGGK